MFLSLHSSLPPLVLLFSSRVTSLLPSHHNLWLHHGKLSYTGLTTEYIKQPRERRKPAHHRLPDFLRMSSIMFRGDASSQRLITLPLNSSRSLPDWLCHVDSDVALLGTNENQRSIIRQCGDDGGRLLWECPQPPINWFGNEIIFTFVNCIDRYGGDNERVSISIIDTKVVYAGGGRATTTADTLLCTLMEQSRLSGGTVLSWQQTDRSSWLLSAKLDLTLHVPLPSLVPLPPGFNTLGSSIVKRTCRSRLVSNLEELQEQYRQWAVMK